MIFQMRCTNCKKEWNSSFGVVGNSKVYQISKKCPNCRSPDIRKVGDGSKKSNVTIHNIAKVGVR